LLVKIKENVIEPKTERWSSCSKSYL